MRGLGDIRTTASNACRAGMSNAESIELMSRDSGKAFDSRLFDLFCRRVVMRTAPPGAAATPAGAPMRRAA